MTTQSKEQLMDEMVELAGFPRNDKPENCPYHLPASLPYPCPNCQCGEADPISETLASHWLQDLGCRHYENGTGDNAASCWCGWQGERVPNVGSAVATWAVHVAAALRAQATSRGGETPANSNPSGEE